MSRLQNLLKIDITTYQYMSNPMYNNLTKTMPISFNTKYKFLNTSICRQIQFTLNKLSYWALGLLGLKV